MSNAAEAFFNGARMARELAAKEARQDERQRHIERAEWYEQHGLMMVDRQERNEMREAAE